MRPDETLGAWVALAMHSLSHAFFEVLQKQCKLLEKPYAITPPQWSTLAWLDEYHVLPIGVLAQKLGIDASVATGIVKRLELQGLIERVHDQTDRRIVRLSLTSEGREIVHQLTPVVIAFNERSFGGFSQEQQQAFLQQLRRIISNVAPETKQGLDDVVHLSHERSQQKQAGEV
jgi:DNA-binding MarR family transcriptional regulator